MSRSTRQPIVKIGAKGDQKKALERRVRRSTKNAIRSQDADEDMFVPDGRVIVDDYDYVEKVESAKHSRK